jgi:hypothetical protein
MTRIPASAGSAMARISFFFSARASLTAEWRPLPAGIEELVPAAHPFIGARKSEWQASCERRLQNWG